MRKTFLVLTISILFTACQKKSPQQYCWACTTVDSVSSNVPALAKSNTTNGEHCMYTADMINSLIKTSNKADTIYNKNDTIEISHPVMTCVVDY